MPTVTINGKSVRLGSPDAKGGEAEIFFIGDHAVKLYKQPDHPDFGMDPDGSKAASHRLATHQTKLPAFPAGLPQNVIRPEELVYDRKQIIGYVMRRVKNAEPIFMLGQPSFRNETGIENGQAAKTLASLRNTVAYLHGQAVVIGDFNDLNVMVDLKSFSPYIIDADSFQYGKWACVTFTPKFLDPLLSNGKEMTLAKPHGDGSDWYAFSVMLMQTLLFVGPYGGVYRPKDKKKQVSIDKRPILRVTVFDPEVVYPKHALHWSVLPDELLELLDRTFTKDLRREFPPSLLADMEWKKCPDCGLFHARPSCPVCRKAPEAAKKAVVQVTGTVKATRVFRTSGVIVHSTVQDDKPRWVYHEAGQYRREDGITAVLASDSVKPGIRFRVVGRQTVFGSDAIAVNGTAYNVEKFGNLPVFDTNSSEVFWVDGDVIKRMREGDIAPRRIGQVIPGHTLIWTGEKFGFGFYIAGHYVNAFVFDGSGQFKDCVKLPPVCGEMVDATAALSSRLCWSMLAENRKGKIWNRCCVVKSDGTVLAEHEQEADKEGWLAVIRGGTASGSSLFVPTDDGVVAVEPEAGRIRIAKEFPDTAPYVNAHSRLLGTSEGLWVVERSTIIKLEIQ